MFFAWPGDEQVAGFDMVNLLVDLKSAGSPVGVTDFKK